MTDTNKTGRDLRTSVTVPLQFPVTVDAQEYKSLTMRRPKNKDSLAARKHAADDMERGIFVLARLCDVSPDVIEELDQLDSDALAEQLARFQGR